MSAGPIYPDGSDVRLGDVVTRGMGTTHYIVQDVGNSNVVLIRSTRLAGWHARSANQYQVPAGALHLIERAS